MSGLLRLRLHFCFRFRFRYRLRVCVSLCLRACLPRGSGLGRIEVRVCGSGISECRYSDIPVFPIFREVMMQSSDHLELI